VVVAGQHRIERCLGPAPAVLVHASQCAAAVGRAVAVRTPPRSKANTLMSEQEPPEARRRSVRSFVLRAGRATAGQQRALAELWPKYGVEFSSTPLDLQSLFGRTAPRMLEIGFGAGEALLEFAAAHPDI